VLIGLDRIFEKERKMGKGTFDLGTRKFNLILSVRYSKSSFNDDDTLWLEDLEQWRLDFQRASELLYDATDGKHQLGDILVCTDSMGDQIADAYLMFTNGTSESSVLVSGLGTLNVQMLIGHDDNIHPIIIVHEMGHYIYGLRNENTCIGHDSAGLPKSSACIMEATYQDGDQFFPKTPTTPAHFEPSGNQQISEFCLPIKAQPYTNMHTTNNEQDHVNHASCWQTMASQYNSSLIIPTVAEEAEPNAPPADQIKWVVLDSAQRFVLVIDSSGSMSYDNKLTEAKIGADWWVDATPENEGLAIVSFATTATASYPMTTITDSIRPAIHSAISGITAPLSGMTSIGAGLIKARNEIQKPGWNQAANQVIVLLTDGRQNTLPDPDDTLLDDLRNKNIRVYTIGIGTDVDPILLQHIAYKTGGDYYVS
jgi:uncharacterized protein YegL